MAGLRRRAAPGPPADLRARATATGSSPSPWDRRPRARPTGARGALGERVGHERRRPSAGSGRRRGLKPHRIETFKFSTDPELEAKVRDVVGLYLDPPERAIVLSRRREDPDPGARPDPADAAAAARAGRAPHPRLQAPRHDLPVRGARGGRPGRSPPRPASATPATTSWPSCAASPGPTREGELHVVLDNVSHPQDARRPGLARAATRASPSTSRPTSRVLDEPGRDVVRHPHPPGHPARQLRERQASSSPMIERFTRAVERGRHARSPGSRPPTRSSPRRSASRERLANRDTSIWACWSSPPPPPALSPG